MVSDNRVYNIFFLGGGNFGAYALHLSKFKGLILLLLGEWAAYDKKTIGNIVSVAKKERCCCYQLGNIHLHFFFFKIWELHNTKVPLFPLLFLSLLLQP